MLGNKRCFAKTCGVLDVVERVVQNTLGSWEKESRLFLGVDVSSQYVGLAVTAVAKGNPIHIHSSVINLRKKSSDSTEQALLYRFGLLRAGFESLRKNFKTSQPWNIAIEDKLLRAGSAKGVIGSHTLAEVGVAARIAAHLEFPRDKLSLINPRTARMGLGINSTKEKIDRSETKRRVIATVTKLFPSVEWQNNATDEDRADACIVSLSAIRLALHEEVFKSDSVRKFVLNCHKSESFKVPHTQRGKDQLEAELDEQFQGNVNTWIDLVWFNQWKKKIAIIDEQDESTL